MTSEFKKIKDGNDTRYVLENASAGGTSSGSIASVPTDLGGVRKRSDNILAQEANKEEAPKPRNFVAKNAKMGGAGKHKNPKKDIPRKAKHKKPVAEELQDRISELKDRLAVAEGHYVRPGNPKAYDRDYAASISGMGHKDSLAYQQDGGANDEYVNEPVGKYQAPEDKPKLLGYYFYNVQPGQEDTAAMYGVKQTKNGKWAKAKYSTSGRSFGMQKDGADKAFGPGRWWAPKNEGIEDASPDTTMAALKGLKSWSVIIMNNYYRGKWSDYSGRYFYVLARSPEEAKQVVLDNADAILQDLLAIKSHNGKKILPRGKAIRITDKEIGRIEDGTEVGRMSTAGYKKMYSPQGIMHVKLSNGAIADVQGQPQQQDMAESRDMCTVCGQTPCNCTHATDEYMDGLAEMLDLKLAEKIPKGADVDYYIKDFAKSNAPQFKGKTPAKRKQMAIAAYYGSKQKK